MRQPNFLIIGAPKCGTTALYYYLDQHPQIYMSPKKEIHFFCFAGEPVDYRNPDGKLSAISKAPKRFEDYLTYFEGATDEIAIGEASPFYMYFPRTAENIKHYLPDVKMIAILRHPVERAYSSFLHRRREGKEPLSDFGEALQAEEQRIEEKWGPLYHLKAAGFYYEQLKRYYDLFPASQIKVYLHEDMSKDASGTVRDMFLFLGVDESFQPDLSVKYNVSGVPKSERMHKVRGFLRRPPAFLRTVGQLVLPSKVRKAYHKKMPELINKIDTQNLEREPCPPEIRRQLIEVYREDILHLQKLLGRDLSHWLNSTK